MGKRAFAVYDFSCFPIPAFYQLGFVRFSHPVRDKGAAKWVQLGDLEKISENRPVHAFEFFGVRNYVQLESFANVDVGSDGHYFFKHTVLAFVLMAFAGHFRPVEYNNLNTLVHCRLDSSGCFFQRKFAGKLTI